MLWFTMNKFLINLIKNYRQQVYFMIKKKTDFHAVGGSVVRPSSTITNLANITEFDQNFRKRCPLPPFKNFGYITGQHITSSAKSPTFVAQTIQHLKLERMKGSLSIAIEAVFILTSSFWPDKFKYHFTNTKIAFLLLCQKFQKNNLEIGKGVF